MSATRAAVFAAIGGLLLMGQALADDNYPRPVPPDIIKQIQTPAKVFVEGDTLHVDGIIIDEAVTEVERQVKAAVPNSIRSLVIRSGGGEGNAGIHFGEIVRDWNLSVMVDRRCMSACANYAALAARELFVPDGALLGFHGGPSKTWGDDGEYLEWEKRSMRKRGIPDRFFPSILDAEKKSYARQQALFDSIGVSSAILTDTGRGLKFNELWMLTREALERCYNVKNIKQYPALPADTLPNGKGIVKVMRDCPRKVD